MLVDAMGRFGDLNPRQVGSEELHRVFGNRRNSRRQKLDGERKRERESEISWCDMARLC